MSTIVTRAGKGSPLTHTEVDANFTNLNNDKFEAGATFNSATRAQTEAALIAGTNVTITPAGSGATRTLTIAASGGGGVTDGDKGDITVSGGGATWTIDAQAVTLSKMANLATSTILGRATAGTGVPEALTASQVRTILNVADGATANASDASLRDRATHTGTQLAATISDFASAVAATAAVTANTAKVTNATHTGDVTGSGALTIANDAVTNAKLANVATATLKGRITAGTGDPEDLTGTQATALLDAFTSGAKGLAPASGGGTTNFLRADGTWAAPAGGSGTGDVVGPASATDNAIARFDATTGKLIQNSGVLIDDDGQITIPYDATPTTPAVGNSNFLTAKLAGYFDVPGFIGPDGFLHTLDASLGEFSLMRYQPQPNSATPTGDNSMPVVATGTGTAANVNSTTNLHGIKRRIEILVTVAAATAVAGLRSSANLVRVGRSAAAPGGFLARLVWGGATGQSVTTHRAFCGMIPTTAPTDVEPSSLLNIVGMGWNAADANIQIMHNDGSGAATKIDLGANFPVPTVDRSEVYELQLYSPNSLTQEVRWRVIRYATTDKTILFEASGVITTDLPLVTQLLGCRAHMSVGGTSSVIGIAVFGFYLATVY